MSLRAFEQPAAQADVDADIEDLREQGLPTLDPAGFHHLQNLARRTTELQGSARRFLDARLAQALQRARGRLAAVSVATPTDKAAAATSSSAVASQTILPLSALALLTRQLHALHQAPGEELAAAAQHAGGEREARRAPAGELRALRAFKSTWSHLRDEQRLAQALAAVPPNAGPLNTQRLVLRALQHMRECSPGYFHRFVSHLETLQWLQLDSLLAHDIQRPGPGIKSRQGPRPSKPRPSRR